ncbi:MAG: hypothetical protein JXB07_10015, partial [Anaerolineae bacterium]|nr:hypothetical protein [Anaerolineae bacterium]
MAVSHSPGAAKFAKIPPDSIARVLAMPKSRISIHFEFGDLFYSSDSILMMTIGGSAIIVVVIFCVTSVFGMLTGNWDIVHLDPFCGMPLALMLICIILTGASAVLVARSRGVV